MVMKIRKGDRVKIITGKDKGKTGPVLQVFKKTNRVLVEGINIVKRHVKPGAVSKEGGIVSIEKPVDMSNVMYWDEKASKTVRVGYKIVSDKKHRVSRETEDVLEAKK
jgi:large subunit ribosomal protein L24